MTLLDISEDCKHFKVVLNPQTDKSETILSLDSTYYHKNLADCFTPLVMDYIDCYKDRNGVQMFIVLNKHTRRILTLKHKDLKRCISLDLVVLNDFHFI